MISFLSSIALLVFGYYVYGTLLERIFGADASRKTPGYEFADGVDYVVLPNWKVFLIQFLNIAGLGPIFGAIAGAMFGPAAFLWIVLGSIFAGAVHDYFSGMLSLRNHGKSISEIVGIYLGKSSKQLMRIFTVLLLLFVGTVFVVGPAKILDGLTSGWITFWGWVAIIFIYYILSTLLPIDKVISKIYPVFGIAMLLMAVGLLGVLIFGNYSIPELEPANLRNMSLNPSQTPLFPILFVTIACGAISGFHATQSPLMARCIGNEKAGKVIFSGTMITEGVVALIWAAVSMTFFGSVEGLNAAMSENGSNAAWAANEISLNMLGPVGGILALLGIVAAPITSGDTAFRSARLILADVFSLSQIKFKNRLLLSLPLFILAFLLTQIEFGIIWRYFAWSNQTLATIVLWTITVFLVNEGKNYWVSLFPAVFMTAVCSSYILIAPEGFQLEHTLAYSLAGTISFLVLLLFIRFKKGSVTKNLSIS